MSVDFLIYRPDIPADCAYELCKDYGYYGGYDYDTAKGYRVNVGYLYDDELETEYPELYPDWFEGKTGAEVADTLPSVLRKARAKELKGFNEYMDFNKDKQRLSGMLNDLSSVVKVCLDHPDWKLALES
ncbi:hypothetical protein [Bifidobacterium myosotis]|uniref:Uncharacterized protein n=1 Tax=Bifidobacterium myosotis TaxID=1630166 RepID=A0A5M9ZI29_9BIFI|nr:hypothetical protein [Bifidobacterium myosotis]KAA8827210.1 hypothetical protein EMO91_09160 [Bifidobacterium myosotis]